MPSGTYSASSRSFGEWRLPSGEVEAGDDRRDALVDERGDDRQGAARADEQRPAAERALEGVLAEPDRRRVGRDQAGRRRGQRSTSTSAPAGAASRSSRSTPARSPRRPVPARAGSRGSPRPPTGITVFWSMRRAALDAVDVERGLGRRAQVELLGRPRIRRRGALASASICAAGHELGPGGALLLGRRRDARRSGSGRRPSRGETAARASAAARGSRSAPRRRRARVEVALAGARPQWK